MNIDSSPNKIQVKVYKILTAYQLVHFVGGAVLSFCIVIVYGLIASIPIVSLIFLFIILITFQKNHLPLILYVYIAISKNIKKNIYIKQNFKK